jgi:hypothetical protein
MPADRVTQLLDRDEIISHKLAFARAADDGDLDRMLARFTADCTATYHVGHIALSGRENLRRWYAERIVAVVASSHHLSNFEVRFPDEDTAELRCYLYSWQRFAGFPDRADRHCWARYLDSWVRRPDGWYQSTLILLMAEELPPADPPRTGEYRSFERWNT